MISELEHIAESKLTLIYNKMNESPRTHVKINFILLIYIYIDNNNIT